MTDPIVKEITVPCDAQMAFDIFVHRIASWWPLDGHSASAGDGKAAQDLTIEPHVGGEMYETKHDGTRDLWGKVLEFEPGRKLATTWHPGNNKDNPTRLDVAFEAAGDGCRVTLTHSGWEAWGEKADEMRDNYNGGWEIVFTERFAEGCVTV